MPTIDVYEGTMVRTDTPLAEDLQGMASEMGHLASDLSEDVLELLSFFDDRISLDSNRELALAVLVRIAGRVSFLNTQTKDLHGIREKATDAAG